MDKIKKQSEGGKMQKLFKLLAESGGAIVSSASLSVNDIECARENKVFYVDEHGLGYAWIPKDKILSWAVNDKQI